MKLLPAPSLLPVVAKRDPVPKEELVMFQFHFGRHGTPDSYSQVAFTLVGFFHDDVFRRRLNKIRGLLHYKSVYFTETFSRLNLREYRKMDEDSKLKRKISKLYNEMQKRAIEIKQRNSLFMNDELKQLQDDYEKTLKLLQS